MTAEPRDVEEIRGDLKALADAIDDLHGMCSEQGEADARVMIRLTREQLAADVEPLLARLAAADQENAELRGKLDPLLERLNAAERERDFAYEVRENFRATNAEMRGEVERLRGLVARQLGDCIGCSPETGPEETCPHDGRTYAEWVEIASMVIGRQHANEVERDDLRAQLAAAERDRDEARTERDDAGLLWGRHYNDAMGALETQLAAAQAQLAEAQEHAACAEAALEVVGEYRDTAEARLEAVRALHRSDGYARPTCWGCGREWPCPTEEAMQSAALSAAPQPEPEVAPYETPEEAAANDAIPAEPISPEFRQRLIAAVERPLRVRRAILLLAGHASGHLPGFDRGCRVCRRDWPCEDTQRAAAPALEAFADVTPEPPASDETDRKV